MQEKEIKEALDKLNEVMDRVDKGNFVNFMKQQKIEERSTPTNVEFGTYGFNPFNSANVNAAWRQLLPRNPRRRRVIFNAINLTMYLAISDTAYDISELIASDNKGYAGTLPVMAVTFIGGFIFPIETTGAIWCASITGGGSNQEQKGVINWQEEIFSDVEAIPGMMNRDLAHAAGVVGKLTAGTMPWEHDRDDAYERGGVR